MSSEAGTTEKENEIQSCRRKEVEKCFSNLDRFDFKYSKTKVFI